MKRDFLSCMRGTPSSREETFDNATYPTARDKILKSKTKVICDKFCTITLWTVEAYPATIE